MLGAFIMLHCLYHLNRKLNVRTFLCSYQVGTNTRQLSNRVLIERLEILLESLSEYELNSGDSETCFFRSIHWTKTVEYQVFSFEESHFILYNIKRVSMRNDRER